MSALRKLIPFGNRVLIKRFEPAVKTASGIYLPDADQQKQNEGEVVAVGPGFRNHEGNLIPVQSAVGDKVLLPEYGGSVVKLGSEEFHLFRDEDILGKLE
uniref:10 kDa chaperonin n=1 Tax=Globisporangium ultimum (strain ATCC 200006 / CBS 805.95 / DAOM BR144) TaxID=431595 RepID=K3X7X4_GLOUD